MPIITSHTWADLGYAKLGPKDPNDEERTRILAQVHEKFCNLRTIDSGKEIWIRDKARKKGEELIPCLRQVAVFDNDNFENQGLYEFAEKYRMSQFASERSKYPEYTWESLKEFAGHIITESDKFRAVYEFGAAVSLCDPKLISSFLRKHALPEFFRAYPKGRLLVYETNYDYEKRYGTIRGGYTLSQYQLKELRKSGVNTFPILQYWHHLDTTNQPRLISMLFSYAFYPRVYCQITGPIGFIFIFVFDKPEEHVFPAFPPSWLSHPQKSWDFAGQVFEYGNFITDPNSARAKKASHCQFLHSTNFTVDQIVSLIEWFVTQYNELVFHQTDPCEFQTDGFVDFVLAHEHGLTIDRVFRKALSCITAEETSVRKFAAMEIADLLGTLRKHWTSSTAEEWFKHLFNPIEGHKLVINCLQKMPEPFRTYLSEVTTNIYAELENTIHKSVWMKSKINENGVMVKMVSDKKLTNEEKEESWPEFTANVVRALRNTHHGYLTTTDTQARPSRYLALISGNIPDSMSYLGVLWAFSLLADPATMIGWNWMPTGAYD